MHSVSRTAILLFFVGLVFIGLLLSAAVPAIKPSSGFMYLSHHPLSTFYCRHIRLCTSFIDLVGRAAI